MLEAGGFEYPSHERIYIRINIFIENVANFHLLTPKEVISLTRSVHVNQNGNVRIIFHLLGVKNVIQVHF